MKNKITILVLLFFTSLSFSQLVLGTATFNTATDNASNYGGGWNNGSNLGTGFGTWVISISGGGSYIGPTGQSSGTSFGLWSNGSGNFSSAVRNFTSALKKGEKITVDVGHTATINGQIFLQLLASGTAVFTLKFVVGASSWVINDGGSDFNSGQPYAANTSITFTFTYNENGTYSYTFGTGSGNNFTATNPISGINGIKFQSSNQGNNQNFGFNNLSIDSKYTIAGSSTVAASSDITVPYLDIQSGSTVNVSTGKGLTVSGNLTNNGTMTINSDATTSGSLIVNGTATGNVTYSRYLTTGTPIASTDWHLIAAPAGGQSINSFVTTSANNIAKSGVNYSLTPYDNTKATTDPLHWNHWTTSSVSGAGNFIAGKGYEVLTTVDGTVALTGTVATAQVSIPITVGSTGNAWNLIGNPYPSSIFANSNADATNNFITVNSGAMDPSFVGYYYWDPTLTTPAYVPINQATAATYIAPGQGFFVKSKAGGATINFTTAMRTNQPTVAFNKTAAPATPDITLSTNDGTTTKTTDIKYIAGTSLGLDPGYDAGLFDGTSSNFKLFTHLVQQDNGVDFMLQVLPDNIYDTTVIPVGIDAKAGTQIIFKANATNLPLGKKVFLEDRLLGIFNELNTTSKTYTVSINKDINGIGRFFLHTLNNLSTLGVNDFTKLNFSVIAQPNNNNIRVIGNIEAPGKLDIYDTLGRLIKSLKLNAASDQSINVPNMAKGIYFVKVKSPKVNFNTKIAWY